MAHRSAGNHTGQEMIERLVSLFSCLLFATSALSAEPVGRLFFSPLERAELDRARSEKDKPAPPVRIEAPPPTAPLPATQTVSYAGIVRRSDGRAMLWVNNRIVDEKEALAGLNLRGYVRADGAVVLESHEAGKAAEVKVGQALDVQAGRIIEGMPSRERRVSPSIDQRPTGSREGSADRADADRGSRTLQTLE